MDISSLMRRGLAGPVLVLIALTGCDDVGKFSPFQPQARQEAGAIPQAAAGAEVERDVEAPDVFGVTDKGLWDGRPSLGGVWVAHPDVQQPERVLITNKTNSKSVVGALFRRERATPGPILQVSSDAAVELGMLAGAPSDLTVVALRREKTIVEAPVAAVDEAPVAPSAAKAASAQAPSPAPTAAPTTAGKIEATPLEPVAGTAAAIDAAEIAAAARAQSGSEPVAQTAPAVRSTLEKPYIQIGIFSLERNARDAASRITKLGLTHEVLAQTSQGKPFWRVIVGPASDASDRAAQLAKIKGIGFSDAYPVTN